MACQIGGVNDLTMQIRNMSCRLAPDISNSRDLQNVAGKLVFQALVLKVGNRLSNLNAKTLQKQTSDGL
jgi:hypothetical protein